MSEDESLLKEFMAESSEHLAHTEADLAVLARDGVKADGEVVRRIFRALHTIKGSSGFFGYTRIGALAHAMESLLDRLRDGRVQATKDVVDALFEGLDRLASLFSDVGRSNEADTSDIEARIRALVPRNRHAKNAAQKGTQEHEASGQIPRGHHLYRLLFDGTVCVPTERPSVLRKLEGLGKVHEEEEASTPDAEADGDLVWPVLFSSVLEKGLVEVATGLPSDRVAELLAPVSAVPVRPPAAVVSAEHATPACAPSPGDANANDEPASTGFEHLAGPLRRRRVEQGRPPGFDIGRRARADGRGTPGSRQAFPRLIRTSPLPVRRDGEEISARWATFHSPCPTETSH